jgi:transglutaminase-like putative cysteine protease
VNGVRRLALGPQGLRLAAFAALAVLAAIQWARLVEAPPVGRIALAVLLLITGAATLVVIAARRQGQAASWALAALAALLATAAGLVAVGVPVRVLEPGGWGELGHMIGRGFAGLAGDVGYPYDGDNDWSRLVLLAGLPLGLGIAAALAFWPGRGAEGVRRMAPLIVLAAVFGVGTTIVAPDRPLLWGFLLLLGVLAWLWLPSLSRRDALGATGLVAVAGVLALPVAGTLDADDPWIDFRDWELGSDKAATFDWDHSYGPLDWPRDGTTLFAAATDKPQYWKTAVLDRFDGRRWLRPSQSPGPRLETPIEAEGLSPAELNRDWLDQVAFTIGPLESEFVLAPGALVSVEGLDYVITEADGTSVSDGARLHEGLNYSVVSYVPDPSPERMRSAPQRFPEALSRYTAFSVHPQSSVNLSYEASDPSGVQMPLWGSRGRGEGAASRAIADSPYASTYNLTRTLTAGAPTTYDAVQSVQEYLHRGFTYNEDTPRHRYPLPAFLLDDKFGYCQQFSGAMALMLRMSGIPARVASGFSPGTPDPDNDNRYLVEDLDAHSWVEVYFPRIGWVTFDPTPAGAPSTGRSPEAVGQIPQKELDLEQQGNKTRKGFAPPGTEKPRKQVAESGLIPFWTVPAGIGLVALLAAAALSALTAVRLLRYRALSPAAAADAHLRELSPALARLGWPIKPGETLLSIERRLRRYRKLATARYIGKLRVGRFSRSNDGMPTLGERRAVRTELAGKRTLRARLRGLLALRPGGPGASDGREY